MGTNDKPNVIHLGHTPVETPKKDTAGLVNETREGININSHLERLLSQAPKKEEICHKSEIKEARTFTEQEILETVLRTCALQGIDLGKLEKTRIIRDENKTIVVLEVMAPDIDKNGGYTEITYTLRGNHGMNKNPNFTKVDHANYDQDQMPDNGFGEAAKFVDGKWALGVHVSVGGKEARGTTCEMLDGKFIFKDTETNEMFEITVVDGKQVVTPIKN